jgi:hypothetical protein
MACRELDEVFAEEALELLEDCGMKCIGWWDE